MRVLVLLFLLTAALSFTAPTTPSRSAVSNTELNSIAAIKNFFIKPEETALEEKQRQIDEVAKLERVEREKVAAFWQSRADEARIQKLEADGDFDGAELERKRIARAAALAEAEKFNKKELTPKSLLQALWYPWLGVFFGQYK